MTTKKSRSPKAKKILFVTSEAHPLIKTGGLGDVSGALPMALKKLRQDIRVILPAYRDAVRHNGPYTIASLVFHPESHPVRLLEGRLPGTDIPVWLVDIPSLFDRPGNPYLGPDGRDWHDNALRFAMFARAVTTIALDQAGLDWRPDVVHCNDWQTGLIPALLSLNEPRPATVFTIHNLAYQGLFPAEYFRQLGLPAALWGMNGLEFYGGLSFIKGGLLYADMLSTVSPTYAKEICTPAYGCGLDGLLRHRADRLAGILNGADYEEWDPARDLHLPHHYDADMLQGKAADKAALQRELGLSPDAGMALIGFVGRLVEQKGVDLLLTVLDNLFDQPVQVVVLGSGDKSFEQTLLALANRHPQRCHVKIGFSEPLAHRIEAAADIFLMPSRYEPCGLNQIYSLRYGTVPIVRRTGGLADTVIDFSAGPAATGFVFEEASPAALAAALQRALSLYANDPKGWRRLVRSGMGQNFSWQQSAGAYLELYQQAVAHAGREKPHKAV